MTSMINKKASSVFQAEWLKDTSDEVVMDLLVQEIQELRDQRDVFTKFREELSGLMVQVWFGGLVFGAITIGLTVMGVQLLLAYS